MQPGIWQILIIAIVVLVLFGRGRISEMMGDFGKGISSFKKGMSEEQRASQESSTPDARIEGPAHDAKPAGETVEQPASDKTAS
ncbi:twin-arginine translocase TatA/TatE family subunit [Aurantiacibacter gangjinensis]|uniref:Sec-independent protein translocase protein TatA n=1 Tax=Aurantiacibacter gangjinensis TaxID=502682 RepID=A0A0G9MW28_9SPHN|nr:twin-arginine translocase TatA/TatE family subunit [Aurantiacibacter gangjinensis]APE27053.1 Twin-arginine translocation protein TatA [Aurantiacibacter gangjinensis]KLE33483.1 preprotein translocase subunit TatA [Aurantiacibacter gangjinensis]